MTANRLPYNKAKAEIDITALKRLAILAFQNGTEHAALAIALEWAEGANNYINELKDKISELERQSRVRL